MRLRSPLARFLLMIVISGIWTLLIPGLLAYKNNVFYGKSIQQKISDSVILSRIEDVGGNFVSYPRETSQKILPRKINIVFSGFGDNRLNFIWFSSYTILLTYIFVLKRIRYSGKIISRALLLTLLSLLLFHAPNWFRNSELGQNGRTIYSFVNLDVDVQSFFLQELRGYVFCFLLSLVWSINECARLDQIKLMGRIHRNISSKSLVRLSIRLRKAFFEWQRDTLIYIILFIPWTWFYWKNIAVYGDHRFLFSAIIFHVFWVVSLIVGSLPIIVLAYGWWKLKIKAILCKEQDAVTAQKLDLIYGIQPIPKSQLVLAGFTTFVSLLSPFVQVFFK